jgi:hypothetical protein
VIKEIGHREWVRSSLAEVEATQDYPDVDLADLVATRTAGP